MYRIARTRILACIVLVFALLASGCAEINVRSGYPLSAASGKGVLAAGITADDMFPPNFYWHLRRVGRDETRDVTFHTLYNPLIWDHPRGRLVFIELEDGDYEFFDWGAPLGMEPAAYFRIPFSIRAGRVTYLGRIHLGRGAAAQTYIVTTSDHYADDRLLLAAKISNLTDTLVDQSPAVFQPCHDASCRKPQPVQATGTITIPIIIVMHRH